MVIAHPIPAMMTQIGTRRRREVDFFLRRLEAFFLRFLEEVPPAAELRGAFFKDVPCLFKRLT